MAKTTAPLLSFGATGQVAKTAVYAKWRGIPYVRRHVIPANPKSTAQTTTRTTFATLREMYKLMPALGRAPWDAFAKGRPFTGMNAFVGENMRVVRGDALFTDFLGSPGANGGLSIESIALAAGAAGGNIDATVTMGTIPTGWSVARVAAVGFPDQDPSGDFGGPLLVGEALADPWTVELGPFPAGVSCIVAAWAEWTKPDGKTAYSVGLTDTANASA